MPVDNRPAPLEAIDEVVDQPLSHEDPRQIIEQKEVALGPARLGADVKREVELGLVTELRYHAVAKCAGEWGAVPQSSFLRVEPKWRHCSARSVRARMHCTQVASPKAGKAERGRGQVHRT